MAVAEPEARPASTTGTTNTVNTARYAGNSQRAVRRSSWSAHSTTPTRNWRGRQKIAAAASSAEAAKEGLATPDRSPSRVASSDGAPSSCNSAKTPTDTNASSLTTDSNAMASITPSWCSVALSCRVPNRPANSAISNATPRAGSAYHA